MKFLPTRIKALTLATLCLATVSTTQAMPMYDGSMAVDLKLTDVTDEQSNSVSDGWSATAQGGIFDNSVVIVGDATGDNSFTLSPFVTLGIGGDFASQVSRAFGSATNGSSQAFGFTDLSLVLQNSTLSSLTFFFEIMSIGDASVSGDSPPDATAFAYGQVALLDATGDLIEIFDTVSEGTPIQPGAVTSNFQVTVGTDSTGFRTVTVDSFGEAFASPIPAPASIALLGPGFFGLLAARRRKQI
jgi:hypothetical protein